MQKYFITGIDTNVGKTIVAAVLTEKLKADYWKPIQSGISPNTDTDFVKQLISNRVTQFHKESYLLQYAASPHYSAKKEGIEIAMENIFLPNTNNTLIIEGAGGLLVPLNNKNFVIDLAEKFNAEVILVVKNYLGSINHSLLSINYLIQKKIPVKGIVICGELQQSSEDIILKHAPFPLLGRIPMLEQVNKGSIINAGKTINF